MNREQWERDRIALLEQLLAAQDAIDLLEDGDPELPRLQERVIQLVRELYRDQGEQKAG